MRNNWTRLKFLAAISLMMLIHFSESCLGQELKSREQLLATAREIIEATGITTLITIDSLGQPKARAMDPFLPDSSFVIWLATNPRSRKVEEIRRHPLVSLYYFDNETASYVTCLGQAKVITDLQALTAHWKPEWINFYPNYPEDYALIKFVPTSLEIVSVSRGINSHPTTWQPTIVWFNEQE